MSSVDVASEALADLQDAQKSRTYYKAAGLTLQFYEAYALQRGLRSLVRREVTRFFEQKRDTPPDVPPEILERLLLIRNQAGPVVNKLRRYTSSAVGPSALPDLQEMAMAVLLSTPQGRDAAVGWLSEPDRYAQVAQDEMKRIAGIVESFHAGLRGAAPAAAPAPAPPPAPVAAAAPPAEASAQAAPVAPVPPPPAVPPDVPEALKATGQRGQVTLTWSASKGARAYTVKRSADPAGPFETVIENHPASPYVDRTAAEGKTYYYTVLAVADGLQSAPCSAFPVEVPAPPSAPGNLEAKAGARCVDLRWLPAADALRYRVKRTPAAGGAPVAIGECADPSYGDATVEAGKSYHYVVSALNDAGEGADSSTVEVRTAAPPAAPAGLSAQPLNAQVTLSWEASSGAERYTIKRALKRDGKPVAIASGVQAPPYTDTTVSNGTTYFYVVTAVNAAGEGPDSAAVEAAPIEPPRPPAGLSGSQVHGAVMLTWSPAKNATSYTVKRGTVKGGPYTSVASKLTQPSFKDDHVSTGTRYFYVVHSVHGKLGGPRSAEVSVEVVAPPAAPTGLVVVSGNAVLTVRWTPTPGATGYHVKKAEKAGGPFKTLADTKGPSASDRDVMPGLDYHYVVKAVNAAGDGPDSAPIAGRLESVPGAPKELKAAAGNGQVSLTWHASAGATGYVVQRSTGVGGSFSVVATIGAVTTFMDAQAPNGATHEYRLLPINDSGEGPPSNIALATPQAPPAAPTALEVSTGDGRVMLTWGAAKGAVSYVVKRSAAGTPMAAIGTTAERTYADGSVTNGTAYRYAIAAVNAGGESPNSAEIAAMPVDPPAPPVGIAVKPGNRRVTVAWFATPGATSYGLRRATSPDGPYITVGKPTEPAYEDTSVENGTKYYYVVNAFNPAGRSPNSDRVEAVPTA